MGERGERSKATLAELLDRVEELFGEGAALGLHFVAFAQQVTEGMHLLVDRDEGRIALQQFVAALALSFVKATRAFSQGGETAAVVLELGRDRAQEGQEVMENDTDT